MPHATLTASQFADFSGVIASNLGIKMPPAKQVMLQSRLHRRLRELGLESFDDYHARFFGDPAYQRDELEQLLNLATTNKTDFFREPDHFAILADQILPTWLKQPRAEPFRAWCAGCSTGEEAYTIAMVLAERSAEHGFDFRIRATDVSTRVLHTAMQAVYPEAHAAPIPLHLRQRYLLRSRDPGLGQVRIAPEIRERVRFGHLNFLAADYGIPGPVDVVFFRNVMIYFDRPTQQEVVSRICRHLRPGGDLFIAHSETLQGLDLPVRLVGAAHYRHEPRETGG